MTIEELYYEYEHDLIRFARSISKDNSEAEDLVQETLLRAIPNEALLDQLPDYKKKAWLFKVLKNCRVDRRRKEQFEVPYEDHYEPKLDMEVDYTSSVLIQ